MLEGRLKGIRSSRWGCLLRSTPPSGSVFCPSFVAASATRLILEHSKMWAGMPRAGVVRHVLRKCPLPQADRRQELGNCHAQISKHASQKNASKTTTGVRTSHLIVDEVWAEQRSGKWLKKWSKKEGKEGIEKRGQNQSKKTRSRAQEQAKDPLSMGREQLQPGRFAAAPAMAGHRLGR